MDIQNRILNKCLKIQIKDGRVIYGILHSFDKNTNMIIHDAAIQLPDQYISPINQYIGYKIIKLGTAFKLENLYQKYFNVDQNIDQEIIKQKEKEFWKNKYYSGQIMLPGKSIEKIEIQIA